MDLRKLEEELGIENYSEEELEKSNEEVEDIINLLNSSEDGAISLEEDNSEQTLEELIEKDENTEIEEIDTEVIKDISTYDDENNKVPEDIISKIEDIENESNEENNEQNNQENIENEEEHISIEEFEEETSKDFEIHSAIIYFTIFALIAVIAIFSVFFVFAIKKANEINLEKQIEKENEKIQASNIPKEANSAYIGIAEKIDSIPITLEKISVDSEYLKLFLISDMEYQKYKFSLTNSEKFYPMDINFVKKIDDKIELRFYNDNTLFEEYTLNIESLETGEKTKFTFKIPKIEKSEKIKYLNHITENKKDGFCVNITGGKFCENGTSIYYSIQSQPESNFEIQQGFLSKNDLITLKEENKPIEILNKKPLISNFDDKLTLGRIDFEKVSNYNSNLVLSFNDLYKKYKINKIINLNQLQSNKNSNGIEIEFDKYKLFIEGMPIFDDTLVLVFHCEDSSISTENKSQSVNRVQSFLNAEIYLTTKSGMEVVIKPTEVKSADVGTDMIFKLSETEKNLLNNTSPSNIKINIDSALIKTDDVHMPINLSKAMEKELIVDKIMEEQIKSAFLSRLDYKYSSKNSIKGFAENILQDKDLMQEYEKDVNKLNPSYEVLILSKRLEGNEIYAIVQEFEKYELNGANNTTYKTHKIKAIYENNEWNIVEDEIIK